MVKYTTIILKFDKQGEKTGWTYIEIPVEIARKLKPGNKKSFRVKGKLDNYSFEKTSLLPMGNGNFILPINAAIRKAIGKRNGALLRVQIAEDKSDFVFNSDLMVCLDDEPVAMTFFKQQPGSHQKYFSKWVDSAKTDVTKAKKIAMVVNALSKGQGFVEMIRANTNKRN